MRGQKKEVYFHSTRIRSTEQKPISKIGRTHANVFHAFPRVPSRFNYERNRSEQRSSTPLPLLSSIVPHSDRHKVSSFVFVAESCEPNPSPARPLTTRMTDDERRRLIHIDSDIWIPGFFDMERVSSRVRHDSPPHPRDSNGFDSSGRKNKERRRMESNDFCISPG